MFGQLSDWLWLDWLLLDLLWVDLLWVDWLCAELPEDELLEGELPFAAFAIAAPAPPMTPSASRLTSATLSRFCTIDHLLSFARWTPSSEHGRPKSRLTAA